jgi:hypothetical protein
MLNRVVVRASASVLGAVLLWGCESIGKGPHGAPFVLPQAAGLPLEQVARVMAVSKKAEVYTTGFDGLFDKAGDPIRSSLLPVAGDALVLTPGQYQINVICRQSIDGYRRTMKINVQAGQTYSIWCQYVQFTAPRVVINHEAHAAWDARRVVASSGTP